MHTPEENNELNASRIFSADAFEEILEVWRQALIEYLRSVPDGPVMRWTTPAAMEQILGDDSFEEGVGTEALLEEFRERVLPWCEHHYHPLVAGHMVGCPLPVAVVADLAASLLNQGMGIWEVSPGPVALAQKVIGWLLRAVEFGPRADGLLTSGGTEANLTAVLAARSRALGPQVRETGIRREDRPVIIASELTHYSIARAAGVAGIGRSQVETIPVDSSFRMKPEALERAVQEAISAGKRIICVVATAGATSTGTFDPLPEIADVCSRYKLWLHVDGAHGASLLFTRKGRRLLEGVERADSLSWDPHKMLFVPSALGSLLVADGRDLEAVFDERPAYLFGGQAEDEPRWNFTRKSLRCTQRFDALRLWAALRLHGRREIGNLIERTMQLAHDLWDRLEDEPQFTTLLEPPFNIVCFRFRPAGFQGSEEDLGLLNEALRTKLLRDGSAWITTTELNDRLFLRAAIMNPASSESDMEVLVTLAREAGESLWKGGGWCASGRAT